MCGVQLEEQNSANMCIKCVRQQVDITDGLPKQLDVFWCRGCERYLDPPTHWIVAPLESKELLQYCVKKVRGLNKVKLIDASFIWTEPHSRRIKVKLTIQKEVLQSTILQQTFIVEYVVHNQFCDDCHKIEAKNTWQSSVQVRQRVNHKRTFFWLEQIIMKHKAHTKCVSIKEEPDGLDFFFMAHNHATKFLDFLGSVVPIKFKQAKQLISADLKSNVYNYKHTYSVEIPPICKEDLIVLPTKLSRSFGDISPLVICTRVANVMSFIDPFTLQVMDISNHYWHNTFKALADRYQCVEFVVIDVELLGPTKGKLALAEVTVAKGADFGKTDKLYYTKSHLGNVLMPGDSVAGYDMSVSNFNEEDLKPLKGRSRQSDILLVRKLFPNRRKKVKARNWTLNNLAKESEMIRKNDVEKAQQQYEEFLRDIEEDPEMRSQILLFKKGNNIEDKDKDTDTSVATDDELEPDFPEIKTEELLDKVEEIKFEDIDEESQ
jgi:nonsense-mediated mRNA decay protein 3